MLTEFKSDSEHYYVDESGIKQGVYERFREDGSLFMTAFYVDNRIQGMYKEWWSNGQLREWGIVVEYCWAGEVKCWNANGQLNTHNFLKGGEEFIDEIVPLVKDIENITPEERTIIKIKFDIDILC